MVALRFGVMTIALGLVGAAWSDAGSVTITSPAEGAKVGLSGIKVSYEVAPGPKGDHVHFFLDGDQLAILPQLKGSYTIDKLTAGRHWACVRVVNKAHTPVGLEKCVTLNAGNVPPMGY
jgi:hypothetical protein